LCTTLERTGVAGKPDEWPNGILDEVAGSPESIRNDVWARQTGKNGVFGVKFSCHQPALDSFFSVFGGGAGPGDRIDRQSVFESVFPNCRHIVMTRRNKIRLAVSWWKSISGGAGHLSQDGSPLPWQQTLPTPPDDLESRYDFHAITSLMLECVRREAALQELFDELGVTPLAVTYEDFIANYDETVRRVLAHIGVEAVTDIPPPLLAPTSDDVNQVWVERVVSALDQR